MAETGMAGPVLLRVGQMFDGDRAVAPLADAGIVVGGRRILDRGPFDGMRDRWRDLPVVDHGDATAIPGLVDCHVHLTMPGDSTLFEDAAARSAADRFAQAQRNALTHLRAGVTSMRDVGSHRDLPRWRDGLDQGMPRMVLCCAPLTAPRGHMYLWGGECSDLASIEEAMRRNVEAGSDAVKIAATGGSTRGTVPQKSAFTQEQLDAIVRAGHRYGQRVTAHAMSIRSLDMCMAAGIDGVEHVSFLEEDGAPSYSQATGEALARSGTVVCATISTRSRSIELIEKGELVDPAFEARKARARSDLENARRLHELGARIVVGTDAGFGSIAFGEIHREMTGLHAAGFGIADLVHAGTFDAARYLDLDKVGRLAPGWAADIAILGGRLSEDVSCFTRVKAVYKAGVAVDMRATS